MDDDDSVPGMLAMLSRMMLAKLFVLNEDDKVTDINHPFWFTHICDVKKMNRQGDEGRRRGKNIHI